MTAEDTTTEDQTNDNNATEQQAPSTDTKTDDATSTQGERLPDDHPVVKALAKANKEAEQARLKVKEFEDAQKSEQQKLTEALEAATADSNTSKAEAARLRAAITHGLPEDDLELLGTGTPEEIEERAAKLAARLAGAEGKQPVVTAARTQGGSGGDPEASPDQWLRDAARR